ncbi:MAG: ATP-dependent DNA helicase [Microbacter sp.]
MIDQFLTGKIIAQLSFEPTDQQRMLLDQIASFIVSRQQDHLFLLKGYAGTGKTSVVSAVVKTLLELNQKVVLLAPTGRAAKVLAHYAGYLAKTIHKHIYRQKSMTETLFVLDKNLQKETLFIVDEASMIANNTSSGMLFGSGQLLDDLLRFVQSAEGCRLILLGDDAQLPPVMQPLSPALDKSKLESYGMRVTEFTLTQVVRQATQSGILFNATLIRQMLEENVWPKAVQFNLHFPDIKRLSGDEIMDAIETTYAHLDIEETIFITRSNKQANIYNNGIRNRILQKESEIATGDLLMVVKNNYFWSKPYEDLDFLANGDIEKVVRVIRFHEMYGFRFVDVLLQLLDYDHEIEARLLLDSLQTESPKQLEELNQKLFQAVSEDYAEIKNKRERAKQMQQNPYLNALQVKFAYAVTCHKAQGGQWHTVFIDQGRINEDQLDAEYYRWLYTGFTRATDMLFLINFPDHFFVQSTSSSISNEPCIARS